MKIQNLKNSELQNFEFLNLYPSKKNLFSLNNNNPMIVLCVVLVIHFNFLK